MELTFSLDEINIVAKKILAKFAKVKVVGIDGKKMNVIIGGWKVARVLPKWIKDLKCRNQFLNNYII